MLSKLRNLDLTPHNLNSQTIAAGIVLYLIVVCCCIWSLFEHSRRPMRPSVRAFWAFIIVTLPVVGILAYLPFSFKEDLTSYTGFWRRPR